MMARVLTLRGGEREYTIRVEADGITVDGVPAKVPPRAYAVADGDRKWVFLDGEVYEFEVVRRGRRASAPHGSLTAPMPATVVRINAPQGTEVKRGETLIVLEAMKMELPIKADADGVVAAVNCAVGDLVQPGMSLIEIEP
jgi:3-methylcrotonyl-CoA carboxylase alpha subunit